MDKRQSVEVKDLAPGAELDQEQLRAVVGAQASPASAREHVLRLRRDRLRLSTQRRPGVRTATSGPARARAPMIPILSEDGDEHADRVEAELERRGAEVARFDPAWFLAEAVVPARGRRRAHRDTRVPEPRPNSSASACCGGVRGLLVAARA